MIAIAIGAAPTQPILGSATEVFWQNDKAVVSGGRLLSRLPGFPVPAPAGASVAHGVPGNFTSLFVDGKRYIGARHPNAHTSASTLYVMSALRVQLKL